MTQTDSRPAYDLEKAVRQRYARGAEALEPELCCPTDYDPRYLEAVPAEILEKDYGCGDPSRHVAAGETVLDLGSGAGKICYILSQVVGPEGRVIGVDFNDPMLELARRYQAQVAGAIGHDNVSFRKGRIQDLALDLERAEAWLKAHPVTDIGGWSAFETECERLRREHPLIESGSVDAIVSNCVLNLVGTAEKSKLFAEMHRVLRRGGRAIISDIVCDEAPTERILADPDLWSGCISGAFREAEFLERFESAGFYGVEILERQAEPWQVIDGVEFRSLTVRAYKGKEGPCLDQDQAVVYRGPWKQVVDDDGHVLRRGERMAVCGKTYHIYTDPSGPYAGDLIGIAPRTPVPEEAAPEFDCHRGAVRDPRRTKGAAYRETREASDDCCEPGGSCC